MARDPKSPAQMGVVRRESGVRGAESGPWCIAAAGWKMRGGASGRRVERRADESVLRVARAEVLRVAREGRAVCGG